MNRKLRIGIVGANRGESFLTGFRGRAEISALCDLDPQRLARIADSAGVALRYANYEEMLDTAKLDAVVVSTPMPFHAPQCVAALERGIHVLSEVPAATDLEQCWQLVRAARASKARYMMAENCCFMKDSVLVRAMAHAGVFGELYYGEGGY